MADITEYEPSLADLFGPFRNIKLRYPETPVESYYEGEFYRYLGPAAWDQTWDVTAMVDLIEEVKPTRIADLGCGDGRVMSHL